MAVMEHQLRMRELQDKMQVSAMGVQTAIVTNQAKVAAATAPKPKPNGGKNASV